VRSIDAVVRPLSTTTVPPDTGVPSGASTYPVTPISSETRGDCARSVADAGAKMLTSRSNGIHKRALMNGGSVRR
jgi:hypothetical protein